MAPGFWVDRRVLVTGHTGFKGSWLVLMLNALGAKVTGYALEPPTEPAMFALLSIDQSCRHIVGDIRDLDKLSGVVEEVRPEVVFHMAAQPLVRESYAIPIETYDVNVMGTAKLLEACRQVGGVRAIVAVTTDKCYENVGSLWGYRETDRLGGADPYSNSKACSELVVGAYRTSYFPPSERSQHGVGLASARAGNVIGGGDFAKDRIVPDAVAAFAAGQPLQIRYPDAVRPWQHVLEPLGGYLLLAERLCDDASFAEGWNFGPSPEAAVPVSELVSQLADLWGDGATWAHIGGRHLHEASVLKLDITKAAVRLGWRPKLSLARTLALTSEWYLAHSRGEDLATLTRRQIEDYLRAPGAPN